MIDVRSQLFIQNVNMHPLTQANRSRAYLEVAKNFPLGENCKCLTSAECAAKSCVTSKLLSFGITAVTLDPLSVVTPISDFPLNISKFDNADEVVRFRAGETNGLLGDVADWSIMTDRMAFVRRSRGVTGEFNILLKVVGDSALGDGEPSALKCDCESVDCRIGDSGGRASCFKA
jgi:hypothetical protein